MTRHIFLAGKILFGIIRKILVCSNFDSLRGACTLNINISKSTGSKKLYGCSLNAEFHVDFKNGMVYRIWWFCRGVISNISNIIWPTPLGMSLSVIIWILSIETLDPLKLSYFFLLIVAKSWTGKMVISSICLSFEHKMFKKRQIDEIQLAATWLGIYFWREKYFSA